jgi:putative intracellular protease/amidase
VELADTNICHSLTMWFVLIVDHNPRILRLQDVIGARLVLVNEKFFLSEFIHRRAYLRWEGSVIDFALLRGPGRGRFVVIKVVICGDSLLNLGRPLDVGLFHERFSRYW